jgi:hypothetical protein
MAILKGYSEKSCAYMKYINQYLNYEDSRLSDILNYRKKTYRINGMLA